MLNGFGLLASAVSVERLRSPGMCDSLVPCKDFLAIRQSWEKDLGDPDPDPLSNFGVLGQAEEESLVVGLCGEDTVSPSRYAVVVLLLRNIDNAG
jgi:hypothetical protein